MSTMLEKIIEAKRTQVAHAQRQRPIEQLQSQIETLMRPRNFYAAVTKQPIRGVNLIAEIKKASPSAGVIRQDFDPVKIAQIYTQAGADAISVLTDEQFFGGKLQYIQQVKQVSDLPVLRKDFIIDEYQIYESRAAGADAILLIAEVIPPAQLIDMLILASMLRMTSLIEVHTVETLLTVRKTVGFPHERYSLLGINNRDLHTGQTDIGTTLRLADLVEESTRETLISESGIETNQDIQKLVSAGIRAVLIGQAFMAANDIAAKVEQIIGPMPSP